ncbi:MAG: septum formation inhibitor Maf [Xanthomonadales bacterium]|nr:septum formation inhibitor Maf [Xanthomonadales bacterium]
MKRVLVLCSTSRYRRELLARLRLPFDCAAPDIDETPLPNEAAAALSERLAIAKAKALASRFPDSVLIGSDQAATCAGRLLGKPGTRAAAIAQLRAASGRTVEFHTSVAVLDARTGECRSTGDVTQVRFRSLSEHAIERYVDLEPALDCAGSFKCENLGIVLFDGIDSQDPTALIGLPLIATARLLRGFGLDPLG